MGWIIEYTRIGNAEPIYKASRVDDPGIIRLSNTVEGVARVLGRPIKRVRIACKEAREQGASDFFT